MPVYNVVIERNLRLDYIVHAETKKEAKRKALKPPFDDRWTVYGKAKIVGVSPTHLMHDWKQFRITE